MTVDGVARNSEVIMRYVSDEDDVDDCSALVGCLRNLDDGWLFFDFNFQKVIASGSIVMINQVSTLYLGQTSEINWMTEEELSVEELSNEFIYSFKAIYPLY